MAVTGHIIQKFSVLFAKRALVEKSTPTLVVTIVTNISYGSRLSTCVTTKQNPWEDLEVFPRGSRWAAGPQRVASRWTNKHLKILPLALCIEHFTMCMSRPLLLHWTLCTLSQDCASQLDSNGGASVPLLGGQPCRCWCPARSQPSSSSPDSTRDSVYGAIKAGRDLRPNPFLVSILTWLRLYGPSDGLAPQHPLRFGALPCSQPSSCSPTAPQVTLYHCPYCQCGPQS